MPLPLPSSDGLHSHIVLSMLLLRTNFICLILNWKLQVTKGQSAQGGPAQFSFNKPTPPPSEWQHVPEPPALSSVPLTNAIERSITEATEEASAVEDEG